MILAAGEGLRMRPLTEARAKPSLPLVNRPLLSHALDLVAAQGVERVVVNLHHRPETVRRILEETAHPRMKLDCSFEPEILGTAGGIRAALRHFDPGAPLLVLNADSLCDLDIAALAAAHAEAAERRRAPATLAVKDRDPSEVYSPVHLDPSGGIVGIGEAGRRGRPATFIGAHVLSPEAIARIPANGRSDTVRDVYIPYLGEGRSLGAYAHRGWWIEAGNPALYLRANLRLLREVSFLRSLPAGCGAILDGAPASLIGHECEGVAGASVEGSVLGPRCRLGEGSLIARSLVAEGARIGREARVEDSILWEGVTVPDRGVVASSLLIAGERPGDPVRRVALP
jgi:NDP-sugar pyrophosphorylase family protein